MLFFRNRLLIAIILAPLLCAFLYATDSDPTNLNVWDTVVKEASNNGILFVVVFGIIWFFRRKGGVEKV